MKYFIPIFFFLMIASGPALAQGEHARRVAAELLVMQGDARALIGSPASSRTHQKGLNDRLYGSLSALGILMRLADQEKGADPKIMQSIPGGLRLSLNQKKPASFIETLSDLILRYPLKVNGILPAGLTPSRIKRAKEIHETLCAGCHDEPDLDVERPAYNLFKQANASSLEEFTARMIIGVRGDRVTGLGNPLSDEELAALVSHYRSGQQ